MIENSQTAAPRHLSFSGTLQRDDGMILLVRRLLAGQQAAVDDAVWGHSFFGSPRFAEPLPSAVKRCAERELGIHSMTIEPLRPLLTAWLSPDGHIAKALPSYVVESAEQPSGELLVESRWCDPLIAGEMARRSPEQYSRLFVTHATFLPYFGGNSDALDTLAQLQRRATG